MSREVEIDTISLALCNRVGLVVKDNRKATLVAICKQRIEPRTTQVLSVVTEYNFDSIQRFRHAIQK